MASRPAERLDAVHPGPVAHDDSVHGFAIRALEIAESAGKTSDFNVQGIATRRKASLRLALRANAGAYFVDIAAGADERRNWMMKVVAEDRSGRSPRPPFALSFSE